MKKIGMFLLLWVIFLIFNCVCFYDEIIDKEFVSLEALDFLKDFKVDDYKVCQNAQGKFFIEKDNIDIIKDVISKGKSWEDFLVPYIKKYVKPGSVAVDIGAHIGTHTILLSKLVGNNGRVFAFEPQVQIFGQLVMNLYYNTCSNVIARQIALGNNTGIVELVSPWPDNLGATLVRPSFGNKATSVLGLDYGVRHVARITTLDSFDLKNVSFIKIDVEGFDDIVVSGALKTIKKNRPVMLIEIFPVSLQVEKFKKVYSKLNYKFIKLSAWDYLAIPR